MEEATKPATAGKLPFSNWWPFVAGALMGVALRIAFHDKPGGVFAAMTAGFIYFSPVIVGAVTVYVAERKTRHGWGYYFVAGLVANLLFVAGTMLAMIEGLLCAILIAPLFAVLGGIGGLLMGAACRLTKRPRQTLYGLGFLPFLVASLEAGVPLPHDVSAIERTITINAPPEIIWEEIMNAREIRPGEVDRAWLYRIGVPVPTAGTTRDTGEGLVRRVRMAKGIQFDEVITDVRRPRYLRWTYRFREDSFPPHALDEHVVVGGHYFDVKDTSYTLTPRGPVTDVTVRMTYRVSTRFNWYADPLARALMGNLEESNLQYYRQRSEKRS
jgi:uncharacterized protein YndB with AHSA1/START domain